MSDDLKLLATWAEVLLTRLSPAQRRQLLYSMARDLRRSQAQRIKNQQAPDGTPYTPRKNRKNLRGKQGRVKRQKAEMFNKLRTTKHLKTRADANQVSVGFFGRVTGIARVHQEGLIDQVSKHSNVNYRYPSRTLLGFSSPNQTLIRNLLLKHLS